MVRECAWTLGGYMAGRGRNFTVGERAIQLVGVMAGASLSEVNQQLEAEAKKGGRSVRLLPQASYDMLASIYAKWAEDDPGKMWQHMLQPRSVSDLD